MDADDDTVVPVVRAILPTNTATTRGHRSSKTVMRTNRRSFGRMVARVGAGMLLLLLVVAEGAVIMPKEEAEGALLWSNSVSSSPGRQRRVVGADRAARAAAASSEEADPAAAAEEGAARTPRRHRRHLVTKKNPQQVPPTEYDVAVDDDGTPPKLIPHCDIDRSNNDAACQTRCEKIYEYCANEVNACLNDPTLTCYNMYNKIISTCGCDTDITCAGHLQTLGIDSDSTTRINNYFKCLVHHWDSPPLTCWETCTLCVPFTTCHNCCNGWNWFSTCK